MNKLKISKIQVVLAVVLLTIILIYPQIATKYIPTDEYEFELEVEIVEQLDTIPEEKAQYLLVESLDQSYPSDLYVLFIHENHARGEEFLDSTVGTKFFIKGDEKNSQNTWPAWHKFYEDPQIFVKHIKADDLWPEQVMNIKFLYESPLTNMFAPILIFLTTINGEINATLLIIFSLQTTLTLVTAVLAFKNWRQHGRFLLIALAYVGLSMLLNTLQKFLVT